MPFKITITTEAESHWRDLTVREQRLIEAAIEARLVYQPTVATRAVKRLRPNPFAQFQLRVGQLRILYNVEESEVVLLLIGRKVGSSLIVKGKEFHGHQDDPPQPAGGQPAGNPE